MNDQPTEEQFNAYAEKLLAKFKQDPQYELKQELGKLLMIHIDDFTAAQRERYDYLLSVVMP